MYQSDRMNCNPKPKIVFVLNAVSITRCQKRVQEFIDHGYQVDVYGFERGGETYAKPDNYEIETIGYHSVSMSYFKRLFVITKSLRELHKKYRHQKDVIFYYFFFAQKLVFDCVRSSASGFH